MRCMESADRRDVPRAGPGQRVEMVGALLGALCPCAQNLVVMETAAAASGDRLADLQFWAADWFLQDLYAQASVAHQLAQALAQLVRNAGGGQLLLSAFLTEGARREGACVSRFRHTFKIHPGWPQIIRSPPQWHASWPRCSFDALDPTISRAAAAGHCRKHVVFILGYQRLVVPGSLIPGSFGNPARCVDAGWKATWL